MSAEGVEQRRIRARGRWCGLVARSDHRLQA